MQVTEFDGHFSSSCHATVQPLLSIVPGSVSIGHYSVQQTPHLRRRLRATSARPKKLLSARKASRPATRYNTLAAADSYLATLNSTPRFEAPLTVSRGGGGEATTVSFYPTPWDGPKQASKLMFRQGPSALYPTVRVACTHTVGERRKSNLLVYRAKPDISRHPSFYIIYYIPPRFLDSYTTKTRQTMATPMLLWTPAAPPNQYTALFEIGDKTCRLLRATWYRWRQQRRERRYNGEATLRCMMEMDVRVCSLCGHGVQRDGGCWAVQCKCAVLKLWGMGVEGGEGS